MISSRIVSVLLLVSSMTSQVIGMVPTEEKGIAQRIEEELPKELRYDILSSALALRETPKYEVYKKLNVGSAVGGIALNEDNTRAFTGSYDGIVRIWDVENGKLLKELKGHTNVISSVALNADRTLALTSSWDGTARVWNALTGELVKTIQVGSRVNSAALNADGTLALTSSRDNSVRLYNTSTGGILKELKGHKDRIPSVALNADGTLALTGSYDGTARVWNINTGETNKILQADSPISLVALSADGTLALTVTSASKVLVWDAKSGDLLNTLLTNNPTIFSVALSKDGKRALVGTGDGKIQVWNTKPLPGQKETSTPLTVLEGHTDSITTLAFGGADFIASGSFDTTALIWKPFVLEPRGPQEHKEILRQAFKETFSRPLFRSAVETKQV